MIAEIHKIDLEALFSRILKIVKVKFRYLGKNSVCSKIFFLGITDFAKAMFKFGHVTTFFDYAFDAWTKFCMPIVTHFKCVARLEAIIERKVSLPV